MVYPLTAKPALRLFICTLFLSMLNGCTVLAIADVAASTAIGVTKGVVKTTGKVVGAVIPDGDDDEKK